MLKGLRTKLIVVLTAIAALACAVVGILWTTNHYTMAGWRLYPRGQAVLDIRDQTLAKEQFSALKHQIPETEILWSVPFQGGTVPSNSRQIQISSLTDVDVARLDFLTELETVNAEGCCDYELLLALQARRPEVTVKYTVTLGDNTYPQDARAVAVPNLTAEQARLLDYLPQLRIINADGCSDYTLLLQLEADHPRWIVNYSVDIAGTRYPRDAAHITVDSPSFEDLEAGFVGLTKLKSAEFINPDATAKQLKKLRKAYPDVDMHWQADVFGQTIDSDAAEVDISGVQVESVEAVAEAVKSLPKLKKLIMTDCGIDNETMAAFRETMRSQYKVVWTVYFSDKLKARTDDTHFMPIEQGEYYFRDFHNIMNLKYCEDMVCIDVGHATITNVEWLAYMPHLKYLILAHTCVQDISAISNCKELIYLELDWSSVRDYSPLLECTALEDLNLNRTWADPTPISKMTWLKNLWWERSSSKTRALLQETLTETHLEFQSVSSASGRGWRNLPNYYAQRDYLGKKYMA